jgi:sugar lactone lactonase YvrE
MRRFLTLVCLLCLAIPVGISVSGCTRNPDANFCNGLGYGLRVTDVDAITLSPKTGGISMSFGQTRQISSPSASTCKGDTASVTSFSYGTTNSQLVDISPSGYICAGTWNRNTGGGIANYSICTAPTATALGNAAYASAYITASAESVTSNPVIVYIHPAVTSLKLNLNSSTSAPAQCYSQGATESLDVTAYYSANTNGVPTSTPLCSPTTTSCSNVIGTLSYSVGNSSVASINSETNQITANLPGTTLVSASVANSGSSAGTFSTCPPASISVKMENGTTSGTISQGNTQNLVTTITDTLGATITGLTLDYQSTDPIDISASSAGAITTSYPGQASIYAVCQPSTCNPSPINYMGEFGTGLPLTSNSVTVKTPGTSSEYVWYGAPGQSQYFTPVELITGTVGSSVKLPYVPNSMLMDKLGNSLYFGSSHGLMIYNATSNTLSKQDPSAPGVILAVAPDNSQLLINDQSRQIFYLYSASGGVTATTGGLGATAAWTPDVKTLYITDSAALGGNHTDTLYIYNVNTGWSSYLLACSTSNTSSTVCNSTLGTTTSNGAQNLAITVPGVGAYMSGSPTVSHTWCPTGTVGGAMSYYPQADVVASKTDILAATTDGAHILGATATGSGVTLSDIGVSIPASQVCSLTAPLTTSNNSLRTAAVNVNATAVNQLLPAPTSALAFLTYSGATAGATLPFYLPNATAATISSTYSSFNCSLATGGTGAVCYLPLTGASSITAPVAGAFSPDDTMFFVSTTGDNMVHYIDLTGATPKDKTQISPNLPACSVASDSGCAIPSNSTITVVPATVVTVRPRATT